MPLPVFPDIAPPMTPEVEPEDVGISTKMEDGIVVRRARYTKSRLTFYLNWGPDKNLLPTADMELLLDFYQNTIKGSSQNFEWTCNSKFSPYYGQTFEVNVKGGPPRIKNVMPGYWSGSLILQEV